MTRMFNGIPHFEQGLVLPDVVLGVVPEALRAGSRAPVASIAARLKSAEGRLEQLGELAIGKGGNEPRDSLKGNPCWDG